MDLRDLWRPESGLTLRRLLVLIRALPSESLLWAVMAEEEAKAKRPTVEKIRERQEHYRKLAEEAPA